MSLFSTGCGVWGSSRLCTAQAQLVCCLATDSARFVLRSERNIGNHWQRFGGVGWSEAGVEWGGVGGVGPDIMVNRTQHATYFHLLVDICVATFD